jgi:hypothetical protein
VSSIDTSKRIKKRWKGYGLCLPLLTLKAIPVVKSPEQTRDIPTAKRTKVDNSAEEITLGVDVG